MHERHATTPRNSPGFTLLELMVTLMIAVICLSLGVPSYQYVMRKQRTDTALHLLTSFFASARATAIAHRRITGVCPTDGIEPVCTPGGDWSHGWLMFMDADGNRQPDAPEDVLRIENVPLHGSLRMLSSSGRPQIRYLPDGRSAGTNLTVRVCTEELLLGEVIVSNTGRSRVTHPDGSGLCTD